MNEKIDLKEMEKKSWQYTMQDGIMETLLGVLLLIYGITLVTSLPVVFAIVFWIIFIIPAYMAMKKKFTDPRIGQVKLQEDKPIQTASGIFLYMIVVAAIMGIGAFVFFGEITDELIYRALPIFFSIMVLGGMAYAHGKSGSRRFYAYATIALVSAPVFSIIDFGTRMDNIGYYSLFIGSVFLVIGLVIFTRFLHKYPSR